MSKGVLVANDTVDLYDGMVYTLPKPPAKKDILFWDLPTKQQRWERPDIEALWEESKDKAAFEIEEFRRRKEGIWFYNNGVPTYITGHHYYELAYCRFPFGYMEFRDVAKRWWYFWDLAEKSPDCLGVMRAKFRRLGATSDGEAMLLNSASSTMEIHCGIVSKTNKDAKDCFGEIVDILSYLPAFSIPPMEGNERPKNEISFREPAKRLTTHNTAIRKSNSLNSRLDFKATVVNAYDGRAVKRLMIDESAKFEKDTPFSKFWDIHARCLMKGANVYGKAYLPSTINEMEKGGQEFKDTWDISSHNKVNENGRTPSGLWRYFNPAYDGLEGFIDYYGFSVIDTPTPEQAKYIGRKIGAKEYLENERKALEKTPDRLYEYIRQFPFTEKEAFLMSNKGSQFNLMRINDQIEWNRVAINEGHLMLQTGNFMWHNNEKDTYVDWVPMKNGKWNIAWFPKPEFQNKYHLVGGRWSPMYHNEGCFGIDPVDRASTNFKRQSMYACYGLRYPTIMDQKFSNLFFCEYVNRLPIPEDHYEDMIKMCVFYGYPCFGEINVPGTVNYFNMRGYGHYLLDRPEPLRAKGVAATKKEKWMPSRDLSVRQLLLDYMQTFIEENVGHVDSVGGYLEMPKIPFNDLLEEFARWTSDEELTDYDRIVASIFALGTYRRKIVAKANVGQRFIPQIPIFKVNDNFRKY